MSRIFDALHKSEQDRSRSANRDAALAPPNSTKTATAWHGPTGDLAQVPTVRLRPETGLFAETGEVGAETFRVLHHRLELIGRQRPLHKLLVTSAVPKEGKTTVACRLAAAMARSSARVLLIDGDLRHSGVHRMLGLSAQRGLADWLEHREEVASVLRRIEPHDFFYLPAGEARSNPGELLRHAALAEFLTATAAGFDWVVIDSPPLGPFVDAHHLATLVDGVLVVLRCGVTPRVALEQEFHSLDRVFVAGAVLNGARDNNQSYYRYYGRERASRAQTEPPSAVETCQVGVTPHD
jgi:capsular exopolysaccharide synthesis family protein